MDKAEKETHDFMNVDSFSQLPFIRPAPPPREKGIRLFGIEFGDTPPNSTAEESDSADTITANAGAFEHESKDNGNSNSNSNSNAENVESSNRRFECHYCCRNFPTSQALGGHQNAHKRERQHAKRQHLQSAMVHGTISEGQVYGLMNYRFGSYGSTPTMPSYPTWNNNNNHTISSNNSPSSGRFLGTSSYSSSPHRLLQQQPINGSPLAMWRIPNNAAGGAAGTGGGVQGNPIFSRERSLQHPLPLFSGEEMMSARVGPSGGSQNGYVVCDAKTSVGDHVSLDLHL